VPGNLSSLVVADLNGNGVDDLAGLTSDGSVYFSADLTSWTQIPGKLSQLTTVR
jgi:hypothetical protein